MEGIPVQDTASDTMITKFSLRFYIGILLLTTNQPLGWAALLICNTLAIAKQSFFFACLGFALYALTWVMMGLGAWLAGPEGVRYSHLILKRTWRRCVRLFKKR